MSPLGKDDETLRPCPACEHCETCEGTTRTTCYRCPMPHTMECPGCTTCGLCEGTQLVSNARRIDWLRMNPPKEIAP